MRDLSSALIAILIGLLLTILLPVRWGSVWLLSVLILPWVVFTDWRALLGWLSVGVMLGLISQSFVLSARPVIEPAQAVMVTGQVASLPQTGPDQQRFIFRVSKINADEPALIKPPDRIRVSIYGADLRVEAGEQWQLPLKLRRPRGFMNPLRFDYEAWLAARGIDATAYVTDVDQAVRLQRATGLTHWRSQLSARVARLSGAQGQGSALLQGLITGDRRAFSDKAWDVLRLTGTSHLLAISGLHIGLAAGLGYFLGRLSWRYLRLPGERQISAVIVAALLATAYAGLAGFSLPTQRALVMFLLFALASLLARQRIGMNALLLAAVLLLVFDPAAALGASFWLSFTAVGLILLAARHIQRSGFVWGLGYLQGLLTVGLAPLTAIFYGQWSPLGLLVNLLVLPLFSFVIVPAALAGAAASVVWPSIGAVLLQGLAWVLNRLLEGGSFLLQQGMQPLSTGALTGWSLGAAVVAIGLLLLPRKTPLQWLVGPLLLPVLAGQVLADDNAVKIPKGSVQVTWLEVGQGNAAVIQTQSTVTVIDTGPAWGGGASAAAFTLIPFLQERGIEHIDHLVVTHADRDHRGGVEALATHFSFGNIWVGEPIPDLPQQQTCQAGERWVHDQVVFEFLWPPQPGRHTGNAASCVVLLQAAGQQIVFTGDISRSVEQQLIHQFALQPLIIEAPHHGSNTSTSAQLLQAWEPEHIVISAGYRNAYAMPHAAVVERIRCHGVQMHDLGLAGALEVSMTPGHSPSIRQLRPQRGKLLHESPQQPRFRAGREIHYHQRTIATAPTEAGRPQCGN